MDYKVLKELCSINAVATQEEKVKKYLLSHIAPHVDEIYEDNFGNLIARRYGEGDKLMISAHTDQIGFMVTEIEKNGMIRFQSVGGLIPFTLIGQRVVINDEIIGIINTDIDLEAGGDLSKAGINRMYIDIGESSEEDVRKKVTEGDFGNFSCEHFESDELVISKGLDDRVCCFALIEVLKRLEVLKYDTYFVFTSQEEVGTKGAYTAAYKIKPKYGISLDITPAGDVLGTRNSTAKLGKGVGIKLMDPGLIINPEMKKALVDCAEDNNISYQFEVMKRGGTDASAFQTIGEGIKSAALSIPTRHAHTSNEMVAKGDIRSMVDLIVAFVSE